MPWSSVVVMVAAAHAQGFDTHHPVVPAASIAAEGGPGALWVNPANLRYDSDSRAGLFFSREHLLSTTVPPATSMAVTAGVGGFGVGVHNLSGGRSDWSLDYATSIGLPERVSIGMLTSWNLIDDASNYVGFDLGASWRPRPWLGIGGAAQNVGSPDPHGGARPKTGAGLAVRPSGPAAIIGLDYARLFATRPAFSDEDSATLTLRLRPVEGLYLRTYAEAGAAGNGVRLNNAGAGVEVFFGGMGGGWHQDLLMAEQSTARGPITGWIGTDEPGESLVTSGHRVPELVLRDTPPYVPRASLFAFDPGPSWLDTLELLRRTEDDASTRGVLITLEGASMSWARFRELRTRITALVELGKPVTVNLMGNPGNGAYYLASAASSVVLHPAGGLHLIGTSAELQHMRGLLDMVGVEPQFVRRAEYKSAPEAFTRSEPSPASLEQTDALLDGLQEELVTSIASGRSVDASEVRRWIDSGPWTAAEALEKGMVDLLAYPDELDDHLARIHNGDVNRMELESMPQPHSPWEDPAQIAVVYVEGAIVSGESSRGGLLGGRSTGSRTVVRQLERARRDGAVKAVVLRVDSPGGSAFASDEIWRATQKLKEADKPVVVSMGGVAASGGYYVSAGADSIWAEPNTITGSIGVFSGKISLAELYGHLGISSTILSRGRNADIMALSRPWDEVQRARMQELVDDIYAQFLDRVSDGRGLTHEEVEEVARGRVWTGSAASDRGLVDGLGGLQEAIADARESAQIPPRRTVGLVSYSTRGNPLQSLAPTLLWANRLVPRSLRAAAEPDLALQRLGELVDPLGATLVWALHPDEVAWLMSPWVLDTETR